MEKNAVGCIMQKGDDLAGLGLKRLVLTIKLNNELN